MARRLTQEDFIKRCINIYGDRFDFENSIYVNKRSNVSFVCETHGIVDQNAERLMNGSGCPLCAKTHKKTTEEFVEIANKVHCGHYTYDNVNYIDSKTHVEIFCNKHKEYFKIQPTKHLSGQGCPRCAARKSYTWKSYIERASKVHGDKYWIPQNQELGTHVKIRIICQKHKDFYQTAHAHLRGHGCPECAKENHKGFYDLDKLSADDAKKYAALYHVRFHHESGRVFDKIGVATTSIKRRFSKSKKHGYEIEVIRLCEDTLKNCLLLESIMLESLELDGRRYKVHDLRETTEGGWTECFATI